MNKIYKIKKKHKNPGKNPTKLKNSRVNLLGLIWVTYPKIDSCSDREPGPTELDLPVAGLDELGRPCSSSFLSFLCFTSVFDPFFFPLASFLSFPPFPALFSFLVAEFAFFGVLSSFPYFLFGLMFYFNSPEMAWAKITNKS